MGVIFVLVRIGYLSLSLRSNFPVRGLGWGAYSLFPLVACMLHVGGYLRLILGLGLDR